jgi:TubC N-terminal docking domain
LSALAIIKEAADAGLRLQLEGERLTFRAKAKPSDALLSKLKQHKLEIVELLQKTAAIRPSGYSDSQWLAALADAKRLGYPPKARP